MCMLGKLIKQKLTTKPIEGYRGWYIIKPFRKEDDLENLYLYPLSQRTNEKFSCDSESIAVISKSDDIIKFIDSKEGFYAYNHYNDYNDYNDYNYNDNYNYHYNYNYHNNYYDYNDYDNDYHYNYHNNYYVAGKVILSGQIAHHTLGYRATKAKPSLLVKLTPKENLDKGFQKFLEHFNKTVEEVAKKYNIPTTNHVDFK